jgi:hypothetical protein
VVVVVTAVEVTAVTMLKDAALVVLTAEEVRSVEGG